jgi:hypothetical protein
MPLTYSTPLPAEGIGEKRDLWRKKVESGHGERILHDDRLPHVVIPECLAAKTMRKKK